MLTKSYKKYSCIYNLLNSLSQQKLTEEAEYYTWKATVKPYVSLIHHIYVIQGKLCPT